MEDGEKGKRATAGGALNQKKRFVSDMIVFGDHAKTSHALDRAIVFGNILLKRTGSQLSFEGRHALVNAQRFADGESKIRADSRKEPSCPTV